MHLLRALKKRKKCNLNKDCTSVMFNEKNKNIFFGYYDVCPFNIDDTKMLACRTAVKINNAKKNKLMDIGYYDVGNKKNTSFICVATTDLWCWQQGCRLQWINYNGDNNSKHIIYNKSVNGHYGCIIQNIDTHEIVSEIDNPIYSLHSSGQSAISLNFSRLQRLRPGYGYNINHDQWKNDDAPKEDGIWYVDLEKNAKTLIFSLFDAQNFQPQDSMNDATHYFNHLCWNPSGTRFLVFHIWQGVDKKRKIRLLTMDKDGKNIFPVTNETHVSHYWWKSDDEIILYSTHFNTGEKFHIYQDKTKNYDIIGDNILKGDGHPSLHSKHSWMLSDTLVNHLSERNLYIYHLEKNKKIDLASFFSPPHLQQEIRCDLHPRWSSNGQKVIVDTAHLGYRSMATIDIKKILNTV